MNNNHYQIRVIKERCKGCSFCIEFCPQHTLVRSPEMNSRGYHVVFQDGKSRCSGCAICTMVCPEFAIDVVAADQGRDDEEKE